MSLILEKDLKDKTYEEELIKISRELNTIINKINESLYDLTTTKE